MKKKSFFIILVLILCVIAGDIYIKSLIIKEIDRVKVNVTEQPQLQELSLNKDDTSLNKIKILKTTINIPFENMKIIEETKDSVSYENNDILIKFSREINDETKNSSIEYIYNEYVKENQTNSIRYKMSKNDIRNVLSKYPSYFEIKKDSYKNEVYNYSYFTSNKKLREILVKYYFKSKNYKKDEIYSFKNDNKAGFVEKQKNSYFIDLLEYRSDIATILVKTKENSNYIININDIIKIIESVKIEN